jgi:5-methylcytosine-specific restriction endonuclease McrA
MHRTLLLNASFEPLDIVTWKKGIQLLFQVKTEVLEESEESIQTVQLSIKIPTVLRLTKYVKIYQKKETIRFSRCNILVRDKNTCQYCDTCTNTMQLTLDHVIPVVQGGKKSWENIVTACKNCNQKKGGRTPEQAKMKLIQKPKKPHWLSTRKFKIDTNETPERWKFYIKI